MSTAPPHSPPMAMPWMTRRTTSRIGAATPIAAYVGRKPIAAVAIPVRAIVTISVSRRPTRSPMWPKIRPPIGRATKPIAKVANESSVATVGSPSP